MLRPDGYALERCLRSGPRSEAHAGIRESDGRRVVLKAYPRDLSARAASRAGIEFEWLRQIAGPGVPEALELICGDGPPLLVLERVRGDTLEAWVGARPPEAQAFLEVAIQLTVALARLHEARLLHCNIEPRNVMVDPASLQAHLIGFGLARALGAPSAEGTDAGRAAEYTAPEQTGRMGRGVDSRSDLYALGATFYFALTGAPPFQGDALAVMHAHMARRPAAPVERRPELPPMLSRIVVKLLEKEPEDRYQTVTALHHDLLRCRQQLLRPGAVDEVFSLGTADAPLRPRFTKRVFGRDPEIRALHRAYARVAEGGAEVVLIAGAAGAGKSSLVHELRRVLAENGGYLAAGRFPPVRREVPYAGLAAALEALVQQLLTESEDRLAHWRELLRVALGNLAGVLCQLVPDLGFILDEPYTVPSLGPRETQARLSLAVQRFVQGCARQEHPLVLFLDDLQWADAGSRQLLDELLLGEHTHHLLVLAAYRDTEVDDAHPLRALFSGWLASVVPCSRIELLPLRIDTTAEMIGAALGRSLAEARPLAERVVRKTGGNPLLTQQFVLHMHGLGLIYYRPPSGWAWNDAAIAAADIPEGAVALMVAKLERLEPRARKLLEFASCVACEFDAELLAQLSGESRDSIQRGLLVLLEEGLLAPSEQGLRFVHDRIREAAQALLVPQARSLLHCDIARLLLSRTSGAEREARIFEIAEHVNLGLAHWPEALRFDAIELNLAAGQRALAAGSGASASTYYAVARQLFRSEDWAERAALGFELHLQSSESAFQAGDFEGALRMLDGLDRPSLAPLDFARLAMKEIQVRAVLQPPEECLRYALAALRRVGVRWPRHPSRLRVVLVLRLLGWRLRGRSSEKLLRPASGIDVKKLAPILILDQSASCMVQVDVRLPALASSWVLSHYARSGYIARPGFPISAYAAYLQLILGRSEEADRFAQIALEWNERVPDPLYGPRTALSVYMIVRPWRMRRREAIAPLGALAEQMQEVGDREYAYYARYMKAVYQALAGDPVRESDQRFRELIASTPRRDERYAESELMQRCYRLLLANDVSGPRIDGDVAASDEWIAAHPGRREPYLRTMWLMVLCVYGRHERAFAQSELLGEQLFRSTPFVHVADHCLYRGLAAAALAAGSGLRGRLRMRSALRRSLHYLRRCSRYGPDFAHMALLLDAESARLRGAFGKAHRLYQSAAQRAQQQQFPHHAALAHERHAALLVERKRKTEAAAALRRAADAYEAWGARAKADALDRAHALLLPAAAGPHRLRSA